MPRHPSPRPDSAGRSQPLALLLALLLAGTGSLQAACAVTASRVSGIAPLAVNFDASGTTMPASTRPFHDVDYLWSFGDPGSGTWSTSGRSRDAAHGPVSGHVFTTAGTYTVSCTATDAAGNRSIATVTITVGGTDAGYPGTATRCVSRTGSFAGAPAGAELVTSSDLAAQIAWLDGANGRRLLLCGGETWTFAGSFGSGFQLSRTGAMIAGYGAGGMPSFTLANPDAYSSLFTFAADDCRICGLRITGPSASSGSARGIQDSGPRSGNLVMDCEISQLSYGLITGAHLIGNNVHDLVDYGLFAECSRVVILGNRFERVRNFHDVRLDHMDHGIFGENIVRYNGPGYHCFKYHAIQGGPDSWLSVISGNSFTGTSCVVVAPQNSSYDERIYDIVIERNTIIAEGDVTWLAYIAAVSVTFRDNIVDSSAQTGLWEALQVTRRGVEPHPDRIEVAHNVFIKRGDIGGGWDPILFSQTTNGVVRNNIIYAPDLTGTFQANWNIGSQGVSDHNLAYIPSHPALCDDGSGTHVAVDPLFASTVPGEAAYLTLADASPAIDRGSPDTTARRDFAGVVRPQGSAPDLGIHEHHAGSDTTPPTVPTGLVAVALSRSQASLAWTAASDDVAVAGYRIYRDGILVATGTGTGFTDTGLAAGTTYAYAVSAIDTAVPANESARTAAVSCTTPANQAPVAVAGSLTVLAGTPTALALAGSDPDGDALVYACTVPPAHGALTGTGAVRTYAPDPGFVGADACTFTVSDGMATSAPATIAITVVDAGGSAAHVSSGTAGGSCGAGGLAGAMLGEMLLAALRRRR